ncbi:MAG TPA: type II toxin-antitoxin system PemK/MazF family toxin [Pseudolabrys sp.]|nr:type II toxin-antitoxin system PemK/MazF family toxin [Pseudolabrys sp.]
MPHSLRVYKCLKALGISEERSLAIADVIETAKMEPSIFNGEKIVDDLCDAGFSEDLAEVLRDALRTCFPSQRFRAHFDKVRLKTRLVRANMPAAIAEPFLNALDAAVIAPRHAEIRQAVQHQPSPGRVVMCDFTFLKKPEMQKERRAIVVSARSENYTGRCAVVPVSKLPSITPNPHHYEFAPGTYPFFHATEPVWALCDHIYTVSLERLWMVNVNRRPMTAAAISRQHLMEVRNLLGTALGVQR